MTLSKFCGKGHSNWSTYTSTNGKVHRYCKTCQDKRGEKYAQLKKNAKGNHTKKRMGTKKERVQSVSRVQKTLERNT